MVSKRIITSVLADIQTFYSFELQRTSGLSVGFRRRPVHMDINAASRMKEIEF